MKKIILGILAAVPLLGLAVNAKATSTVMFDLPSISEMVGNIYNVAQPILSSFMPAIWLIIGVGIAFLAIRILTGLFHR